MSDCDKLGAIGDINFVIKNEGLDDYLIVVAGDNLFNKSLEGFAAAAKGSAATLALYDVGDLEAFKKCNTITVNAESVITHFEEKPANPTSTLTGIALYYYAKETVPFFKTYVEEGNKPRPARTLCAVALHAQTRQDLAGARHLVRYRKQGNAPGGESDFREVRLTAGSAVDD